jgi:hypothetical protein
VHQLLEGHRLHGPLQLRRHGQGDAEPFQFFVADGRAPEKARGAGKNKAETQPVAVRLPARRKQLRRSAPGEPAFKEGDPTPV